MTYETYLGCDRDELLKKISSKMSQKRFEHVLAVEKTAKELAEHYGYDPEKAALTGLLHDYAKELPDQTFLNLIGRYGLDEDLKNWGNNIWHGVVGIYAIKEDLGVTDEEILQAIARHTVGAADMSLLDKIVYVADYIEPTRSFPVVDEARKLAEQSLDKAVAFETAQTISFLAQKGVPIYPVTLETYNSYAIYLNHEHKGE